MAIVVEDGTTKSRPCPDFVASVLHSTKTKSDKSLSRQYRLSFCREQLGQFRDESIPYTPESETKSVRLRRVYPRSSNIHHFDNRGSMTSRGRNEIAAADNQRFEGYIDGCGMCGSVGHSFNDCPILQEPPPPFRPQSVQESSLEDLMKQLAMNNSQFQKNVSTTQQPVQQLNSSPSLEDLVQQFQQNTMQIQQNNMQFQQNIIATVQELTTQIGQLATTINQLQFEDSGQVPSQAILSPQENISDITVRSDMELPQQQSLKVQYGFSGNPDSENSTTVLGFADSS
ncbi:hypothetical protein CR513_45678, partial [Mucuna pruriens]